ncbi:MAG: DUF4082 domain-containing protein [Burkholderiales bacterium]
MSRTTWFLNAPLAAVALAAAALVAPVAQAAAPAYSVTGDATYIGDRPNTTGFIFTAVQNATVTALGFHDYLLDGLGSAHEVALFSTAGALLAQATVAAGTADVLIGEHRYATLGASFNLVAGTQYVLAAHTDAADGYRYGTLPFATISADPRIAIGLRAGVYNYGPSLAYPGFTIGYDIYATPNMLMTGVVPEPGTWALLCAGLVAVAGVARRRRA